MFSGHFLAAFEIRFSGGPQEDPESMSPDQVLRLGFALGGLDSTLVLLGSSVIGPSFSFWRLGFALAGLCCKLEGPGLEGDRASHLRGFCSFAADPPSTALEMWNLVVEPRSPAQKSHSQNWDYETKHENHGAQHRNHVS